MKKDPSPRPYEFKDPKIPEVRGAGSAASDIVTQRPCPQPPSAET